MIVGAAVCPGAPFLIEGTADAIAARLQVVVDASSAALSRLPSADALLLITSAAAGSTDGGPGRPAWRELVPGTVISTTAVRRSDLPDGPGVALAAGPARDSPVRSASVINPSVTSPPVTSLVIDPSVGTMVGAALLTTTLAAEANLPVGSTEQRRVPTTVFEITGPPADLAGMLAERVNSAERIALLVIADGSACHGDDAPGQRDDRAAPFDAGLADSLAAGDPDALRIAAADRVLGQALLASVDPLTVLALLTAQRPPTTADLLYSGAPLGVGYLVASWGWSDG